MTIHSKHRIPYSGGLTASDFTACGLHTWRGSPNGGHFLHAVRPEDDYDCANCKKVLDAQKRCEAEGK